MLVTNSVTGAGDGMTYAADYGYGGNDRSIPDVGYVKAFGLALAGGQAYSSGSDRTTFSSEVTFSDEVIFNADITGAVNFTGAVTSETSFERVTATNDASLLQSGANSAVLLDRLGLNNSQRFDIKNVQNATAADRHLNMKFNADSGDIAGLNVRVGGNVGVNIGLADYDLQVDSVISMLERSSDPAEPGEGVSIIWLSDGTGYGNDGDICIASQAGGTTRKAVLFDHSEGDAW